jgi:RimJ/RimL family protein N-acetyltransferase
MIDQLELKQSTIRPWRLDDAESLARHANNRKVWRALRDRFPHPYTAEDARKFLEATVKFEPITIFCIEVNDAAVGEIGIHLENDVHRHTAELGYWLGEEFWARGVMTEAVGAFTDFCFDRFSLRRIYAEPFANNPASARVLEKAGFVFEGRLKNNVVKDGEALDSLLYARTK